MKTQIIVAQTHDYVREGIVSSRNSNSPNQIYLTANPNEVIQMVSEEDINVLITGQRFYDQGLMDKVLHTFSGRPADYPELRDDYSIDGNGLAVKVKELSPNTLILRYSITPEAIHGLDGDIPKRGEPKILIDFIDAKELGDLVRTKDFDGLKRRFPKILWYKTQ